MLIALVVSVCVGGVACVGGAVCCYKCRRKFKNQAAYKINNDSSPLDEKQPLKTTTKTDSAV